MTKLLEILIALLEWWQHRDSERLFGSVRSPEWSKVRNDFIKENPLCEVCGKKGSRLEPNQIHHLSPYHLFPEKELEKSNLATACRRCHLLIFHLNSFRSYNLKAREDAKVLLEKIKSRP